MPRGVFNWTFDDVVSVLKESGFLLNHIRGSHFYYIGHIGGKMRQVCVQKHGASVLKPRTFKGIMEQSGLQRDVWMKN